MYRSFVNFFNKDISAFEHFISLNILDSLGWMDVYLNVFFLLSGYPVNKGTGKPKP